MHRLIMYLRSLFCEHDWELLGECDVLEFDLNYPAYHQWVYRCKKCGYKNIVKSR